MAQYIDKAAVVAEIERIKKEECPTDSYEGRCKLLWFEQFLSFIDTLEVKEVDLYEELDGYFAQFKGLEKSYWNWRIDSINIHAQGIYDFAKHFFELGLKAKGE